MAEKECGKIEAMKNRRIAKNYHAGIATQGQGRVAECNQIPIRTDTEDYAASRDGQSIGDKR